MEPTFRNNQKFTCMCFSLADYTNKHIDEIKGWSDVSYLVCSEEINREGVPCLSGYVEFSKQKTWATIKKWGDGRVEWERKPEKCSNQEIACLFMKGEQTDEDWKKYKWTSPLFGRNAKFFEIGEFSPIRQVYRSNTGTKSEFRLIFSEKNDFKNDISNLVTSPCKDDYEIYVEEISGKITSFGTRPNHNSKIRIVAKNPVGLTGKKIYNLIQSDLLVSVDTSVKHGNHEDIVIDEYVTFGEQDILHDHFVYRPPCKNMFTSTIDSNNISFKVFFSLPHEKIKAYQTTTQVKTLDLSFVIVFKKK